MPTRKFAVLTDSACDIPEQMEKEAGIDILPVQITLDGKSYWERLDFSPDEYYGMLENCQGIPATAHITSLRFLEKFKEYDDKGTRQLLYVSMNAGGSNSFHAAGMAEADFRKERPDSPMEIYLVDSHSYSIPFGWYVAQAAFKLQNGAEMRDVVDWLEDVYSRVEIVLGAYTLRFMKKSGRISAAAAFAGELLGVRPVITLIDGESVVRKKVRGDKELIPALMELANERIAEGSEFAVAGTRDEYLEAMAAACEKRWKQKPHGLYKLGAAVATNTGPDAIAVYYLGEKRRRPEAAAE